jgi:exosortase/archaeosortase family protein
LSEALASSGGAAAPSGAGQVRPPWDWNRVLTVPAVLRMLPIVGFLVAAYWRRIVEWEGLWRDNSAWSHGYLIPVIAVVIAHFRLKELNPSRIETCIWGLPVILAGCLIRVWSETLQFGYPGQVTFLVVTAGVILLLLGWPMLKALWVPVLFLGLMIPWNFKYYEGVALPLQNLGAAATGKILELIGYTRVTEVSDLMKGLGGGRFVYMTSSEAYAHMMAFGKAFIITGNVEPLLSGWLRTLAGVCSGLLLLFAFVALCVMAAFIYKRATLERIITMASCVAIALLCSVILGVLLFTFIVKGNVVQLLSGPLTVAEACSGLHLLFAFVALGVMTAFIYKRATWERVLIMASSVPIAVFCNVIRVTLMAIASDQLYFEEGRVMLHAASWSTWAPRIIAWPATAWVGVVLVGAGLFLFLTRGGTDSLERHLSRWRMLGMIVAGMVVTLLTAKIAIGYPAPADLELARQTVLNPQSAPHQAFGFAMLGLAFVLMWAELKVIDLFFIEEQPMKGQAPPAA